VRQVQKRRSHDRRRPAAVPFKVGIAPRREYKRRGGLVCFVWLCFSIDPLGSLIPCECELILEGDRIDREACDHGLSVRLDSNGICIVTEATVEA